MSRAGKKTRPISCPVDEEKVHWVAADRERYYREKVAVRTPEERKQIVKFYHDFDAWLVEVRKKRDTGFDLKYYPGLNLKNPTTGFFCLSCRGLLQRFWPVTG